MCIYWVTSLPIHGRDRAKVSKSSYYGINVTSTWENKRWVFLGTMLVLSAEIARTELKNMRQAVSNVKLAFRIL